MRASSGYSVLWICIVIILCAAPQITANDELNFPPFMFVLDSHAQNDSMIIEYYISFEDRPLDSAIMEVRGQKTILASIPLYPPDTTRVPSSFYQESEFQEDRLLIAGQFGLPITSVPAHEWKCFVSEYFSDEDSLGRFNRLELDVIKRPDRKLLYKFELPMAMGMYDSDMANLDKSGFLLGLTGGIATDIPHFRLGASTNWSGLGKHFTLSEPARFDLRWYTGTRDNFMPQLEVFTAYTKVRVKENDYEFKLSEWGTGAGVAIEGPFERLGYSYNPSGGGYHSFDVFMVFDYGDRYKAGTKYQLTFGDDVWLFRISQFVETFNPDYPPRTGYGLNTRPVLHRVLAFVSFLPFYLTIGLICPGCFSH